MPQPSSEEQFNQALAALIALYVDAEQRLLGGIAGILRVTSPTLISQLAALLRMRRLTSGIIQQLTAGTAHYIPILGQLAITAGEKTAENTLEHIGVPPVGPGNAITAFEPPFNFAIPHGERAAQAIRDDLVSSLDDVRFRITRLPDDVYKVISPAASAGQVLGRGYTPAQAQAYAWREFVKRGVTGFTDKAGRDWSLSAYTEMSIRTAASRAYNDSHLQVMQAAGIHLFTVADDGHPCPLCFPWQGRVLSVRPDPRADATIAEATAAGLFHPNCKHILLPVIPGVTKLHPKEWTPERALAYANTQKQRRLELNIRKAKKSLEYATAPSARQDARQDVRNAQKRMRQFIDQTGSLRQSRREQTDLADARLKLPR